MITLRGRTAVSAGALVILAGVGVPAAALLAQPDAGAVVAPAQGIDVSNHNTVTSWPDVEAGNGFTGVEATEGNYFKDADYASYAEGATAAGMYVTPYVFANPYGSQQSTPPNGTAAQQADYAIAEIETADPSGNFMLPLTLDLETDPYTATEKNSNACYGLTPAQMVTWIKDFISEEKSDLTGLSPAPIPDAPPIIYTTANWWDECTGDSTAFGSDPLWVAAYGVTAPSLPSGWDNYTFWQYSDTGTVSGVSGAVDQDYLGPTVLTSAVNDPVGTVRISTLTSLRGDGDTFTSSTLPAGLSISSSGQITGTPTTAGRYSVTVTPSPGAVPSSVPFTWDIHGAITVTAANRSTSAGTAVVYQVASSGPDASAGFPPSFTASGLPAGLSISSSGLVTGWPSAPGTYHVTVSATDGIGGSGSASFTWTIAADADSGTTGTIRQVGGSGKCLNDPNGSTANGTHPRMWTCGTADENWTWVHDGTIRYGGKCLQMAGSGSAADTALELEPCSSGSKEQQWRAGSDSEIVNPASGRCLYVGTNDPGNGYKPDAHACGNDVRDHWLRPAAPVTSGDAGKCLGVSGSAIEVVTCANVSAQHWAAESDAEFKAASNNSCLKENGATAGSTVSTGPCTASGKYDLWSVAATSAMPLGIELKNAASGLCVTVPSVTSASGTRVVMRACAAAPGTPQGTWHISG